MAFCIAARNLHLENFDKGSENQFDLIVIGGGITGAGVLREAALRGMKVLLLERRDFASGTSSWSSKFLHGGLRYLEHMKFGLVAESCFERDLLLKQVPHLIDAVNFIIPIYNHDRVPAPIMNVGLYIYDWFSRHSGYPAHGIITEEEILRRCPGIQSNGLRGGFYYKDCVVDDSRLTIETLKSAATLGSVALNYTPVKRLLFTSPDEGRYKQVAGVVFEDTLTRRHYRCFAPVVVNVTGVHMDDVRRFNLPEAAPQVLPAVGSHIIFPRDKLPLTDTLTFQLRDKRRVFFSARGDKILVGCTDRRWKKGVDAHSLTNVEIDYLLDALKQAFPESTLGRADMVGAYSGIRPLIFDADNPEVLTSDTSREHKIIDDRNGFLSMSGGKLTTYRDMAENIMDRVMRNRRLRAFAGGDSPSRSQGIFGEEEARAKWKYPRFGPNSPAVEKIAAENPAYTQNFFENNQICEVLYCCRFEMVVHLADLIIRRFRLSIWHWLDVEKIGQTLLPIVAQEMGWDDARTAREWTLFQNELDLQKEKVE